MKKMLVILMTGVIIGFVYTDITIAADYGPEVIVLKTAKAKRPVMFLHKKHQESFSCAECHHGMDDYGNEIDYYEGQPILQCETCHNSSVMDDKQLDSFKEAGHSLCRDCHKKEAAAGGNAPRKCKGCHPPKK